MSTEFLPAPMGNGTVLQAGVPTRQKPATPYRANGLLLRGVVMATYVTDDPAHPAQVAETPYQPVAVYCDVMVYASRPGQRWLWFPRVLVSQDRGGMHHGSIWKPRATTRDITANVLDPNTASNPASFDGDHVLIGFIDDNLNFPIILRGLPHPSADVGNEAKTAGHRMRLKVADGDPHFIKHRGAFFGVSDAGDFTIDTMDAYATDISNTGSEPAAAGDGSTGNVNIKLPTGSKVNITVNGVALGVLELSGSNAKFTLGDGAVSVALGDALQNFWNNTVKVAYDAHTHATGVGPSGPPAAALASFDTAIKSTKVKVPNG